jgi:hypothetical protein
MKVVINRRYGGFGVSLAAAKRLVELGMTELQEQIDAYGGSSYDSFSYGIERHDPRLIQVIEEMGDAANGQSAKLKIVDIDMEYEIEDYDGMEKVKVLGYEYY